MIGLVINKIVTHRTEGMLNMKRIEIYYASVCGLCTKALEFLRGRGVTFTAYAVEWDSEKDAFRDSVNTRKMYLQCGEEVDFVPQLFIANKHIKGWRELKPMIESGEIENVLSKAE